MITISPPSKVGKRKKYCVFAIIGRVVFAASWLLQYSESQYEHVLLHAHTHIYTSFRNSPFLSLVPLCPSPSLHTPLRLPHPPGGRLCPPCPRPCPHHPPTENTRPCGPTRRRRHRGRGCAKPPLLLRLRHWRHDRLGDGLSLTLRLCLEAATRGAPRRARGVGGGGSTRRRRRNLRDGVRPVGLLRVVRERKRE